MKNQKFNNQITLMPKFIYNKTLLEKPADNNSMVNQFWMFNYFILNEEMAQTYFVPISTCRYPNQIAKIRVFPDIVWEMAALVTVPLFKKTTLRFQTTREDLSNFPARHNLRNTQRVLSVEGETEQKIGADFTLKATTNGKTYEAGYKIEKSVKQIISIFNRVSNEANIFNGTDQNVRESAAYRKGVLSKFEFNLDPPNVAIALKWKNEVSSIDGNNQQVGCRIEGGISLKPFIGFGITVDLIPIIGKFGFVGMAVQEIINALENRISGTDVYFNFKLNAEIAGNLSIVYHSIDGWDKNSKRELTFTVNASIEAGVKLENVSIISEIVNVGTDEKVTGIDVQASLGAGVEYKEEWNSDEKGIFKNVTVNFTGCNASFYIYAVVTRRKKRVVQGVQREESYNKQIGKKFSKILLEPNLWYGPKKIYIDDEK